MIDKTVIIETLVAKIDKLSPGHYLDVRPYKRNRSVRIVKTEADEVLIIEDGFFQDRFVTKKDKLRKALKSILKKEFPRSRKIRVYDMGVFDESAKSKVHRKTI